MYAVYDCIFTQYMSGSSTRFYRSKIEIEVLAETFAMISVARFIVYTGTWCFGILCIAIIIY